MVSRPKASPRRVSADYPASRPRWRRGRGLHGVSKVGLVSADLSEVSVPRGAADAARTAAASRARIAPRSGADAEAWRFVAPPLRWSGRPPPPSSGVGVADDSEPESDRFRWPAGFKDDCFIRIAVARSATAKRERGSSSSAADDRGGESSIVLLCLSDDSQNAVRRGRGAEAASSVARWVGAARCELGQRRAIA